MDIFDILLDILLKPPQPFIGLFLIVNYIITVQACAPRGWRREFLDPLLDGSVWLVSLLSLNIQE